MFFFCFKIQEYGGAVICVHHVIDL